MKDRNGSRKTKIHNVRVHKPDLDAFVTNRDFSSRLSSIAEMVVSIAEDMSIIKQWIHNKVSLIQIHI